MAHRLRRFLSRLRSLFGEKEPASEFREEIEAHLRMLTEDFLRRGMSREEAAYAARRQFGNVGLLEEQQREGRGFARAERRVSMWISDLFHDLKYGFRILLKNRGISVIAVASIALGIGANTAVFTAAKAALLDELSVPHPEELRLLAYTQNNRSVVENDWGDFYTDKQGRTVLASFSYPVYQVLRQQNQALGDLFAFVDLDQFEHLSATIDGRAEVVTGELVSGNFFRGMRVSPILGRPIQPADDAHPGESAVAVISYSFWKRRFNGSPDVIGKTIDVNLTPVKIIGVAPRRFSGASHVHAEQDLFMPLSAQPLVFSRGDTPLLSDPNTWWIQIMGRKQPGVEDERARSSLVVALAHAIRATMAVPKDRTFPTLFLLPGGRGWNYAEQDVEHPIPFLVALACFVLLLSCVNVANLLLSRCASRGPEISTRLAIGANRMRIVRQMLAESLSLAIFGGAAGLFLGYATRNLLPKLLSPSWEAPTLNTSFDWRVFLFTAAIAGISAIAFGVVPAWRGTRTDVNAGLKNSTRAVTDGRRGALGRALAALQVSLCLLLLASAGLFLRTLLNLNAIYPGFDKKGLLLFALEPPARRYAPPKNVEVLHRIEEKISQLPGIQSVTLSREALLAQSWSNAEFLRMGQQTADEDQQHVGLNWVGSDFFSTMRIPILQGRSFNRHDATSSHMVAVINATLARKQFGGRNPIGTLFRMEKGGDPIEVVGICGDAKYGWLRDKPPATFYLLYMQRKDAHGSMTFEVRTKGNPKRFLDTVRNAVASVDKDLPLIDIRTQEEQIAAIMAPERSFAAVTSAFGIIALVLAGIGVYGVVASGVSRRVNEIGIRMALGARREQVVRTVLAEAAGLTILGLCAGLLAALFLTRFLTSFLFGLKPNDIVTLAGTAIVILLVAIAAAWAPARRAASIEPVVALRHE